MPGFPGQSEYRNSTAISRQGFTLLEMLVALAIFAVLSVLAYDGLKNMIYSRDQVEKESERLSSLQITVTRLSRDLVQAVNRPIRNEYGNERPAFLFRSFSGEGLEFTRTGWRNPAAHPRSHLQRVAYRLKEDKLLRDSWPVLDRGPGQSPFTRTLLDRVNSFQPRFLDQLGNWQEQWPPSGSSSGALPRAVEITLNLEDWGRIRRLVVLSD